MSAGVAPIEPNPLHVRVPAQRQQTGARLAQHAAEHRQVRDRPNVVDPVRVVRDPHRPTEDGALRRAVQINRTIDRFAVDT